jgi:hypothetical protein
LKSEEAKSNSKSVFSINVMKNHMFQSCCYGQRATPRQLHDAAHGRRFVRWLMICLAVFGLSRTAQALVYQGLTNAPLGSAFIANQLDHGSNSNWLVVSNIGSSGQDGVSIAVPGNLSGLDVEWQALDVSNTLPVGAYIQEQMIGTANGTPDTAWGTLTMTKAGTSNYVVSADYSPIGASTYTVQAYLKGALVAQAANQGGDSLAVCGGCSTTFDWEFWPNFGPTTDWGSETSVLLASASVPVMCDRLYIIPENVPITSTPTAMQIMASQVPVLTITGENASLVYQGLTNTSVGNAIIVNQLDHGSNTAESATWAAAARMGCPSPCRATCRRWKCISRRWIFRTRCRSEPMFRSR